MLVPAMSTWPVSTVSEPSGLSRTVAPVGWRPPSQPPSASPVPRSVAVLARCWPPTPRGPSRAGCSAEAAQNLAGAVALPGLAVGHGVAFLHEVAQPELHRVEPEGPRHLLHVRVDGEDRLGSGRGAVGGDARLVGEDLVAADVEGRPLVDAGQEDGAHREHGAREGAGLEDGLGLQGHERAVALDARLQRMMTWGAGIPASSSSRRVIT